MVIHRIRPSEECDRITFRSNTHKKKKKTLFIIKLVQLVVMNKFKIYTKITVVPDVSCSQSVSCANISRVG